MYKLRSIISKYKSRPNVGATNLKTASSAPPVMSRDVVTLVFSLSPNAKEIKNKITDGIPTAIPRCWSDRAVHLLLL